QILCYPAAKAGTSYEIPASVTEISGYAFYKCQNLVKLTIPTTVRDIGVVAFGYSSHLTEIKFLGNAPYSIPSNAFYDVTATVWYPDNSTWSETIGQNYGGTLTWKPWSGTCGTNLTWTLEDGVLTISGTGNMTNYSSASPAPWYTVRDNIESVVINEGVSYIGPYAFSGCSSMTGISLASSVTGIGPSAFSSCSELTEIDLPAGITSINNSVFYNCSSLTHITIPATVTSISSGAFDGCTSLTEIIFEGSAPVFGNNVFGQVTATAYYPAGDTSWDVDGVRQDYGGTITWVAQAPALDVSFTHSCSVQNNLKIYFKPMINDEETYDNVWLHLERQRFSGGAVSIEEIDITEYEIESGRYKFGYAGIAAAEMGDEIHATLHAIKDDVEYISGEDVYSIKIYAYNMLSKYSSNTKLCTLLVDMLNYGAAAQTYFGYNTSNLVNSELTAAQQALATPQASSYLSCQGETPLEGSSASVITRTLSLGNSVVLRAYVSFDITPSEGTYVQFCYTPIRGSAQTVKVYYGQGGNFTYDSGRNAYQVNLNSIAVADFGQPVEITVFNGNTQISGVYTYSIETYVHNMMAREGYAGLKTLLNAMMCYSSGVKAYFNN
ncbi:MAG: leucine-rich repeat domain-containing protein, partial [Lachnospiraceae bacterium]|nr:leucine-rich repeat domain-containing protein [Lachnospiraceae bacterium]